MATPASENSLNVILSIDNPAFCSYLLCTSLLVFKMVLVVFLTVFYRFKTKSYVNPEDAKFSGGEVVQNESVERARRAHMNDLENIPAFLVISLCYLFTKPNGWVINILLFLYVITRYLHTIIYTILILPQPSRGIMFGTGFLIMTYMSIHTAIYAIINL